ncbi:hypothetical protein Tco_0124310 [Tanacetum coccineum]
MLDSYTSNMCLSSWGRSTYARALIDVSADKELMESLVIAIPKGKDMGHSLAIIEIEYEWKLPRCSSCLIFDHESDKCLKYLKEAVPAKVIDDGFVEVKKKKAKVKQPPKRQVEGVRLNKPSLNLQFRRVEKGDTSKTRETKNTNNRNKKRVPTGPIMKKVNDKALDPLEPGITTANPFSALSDADAREWGDDNTWANAKSALEVVNESDSDVDENIIIGEPVPRTYTILDTQGASTPLEMGSS